MHVSTLVACAAGAGCLIVLSSLRKKKSRYADCAPGVPSTKGKEKQVFTREEYEKVTKQVFAPSKIPNNLDCIVIGSGVGGLTTAAILAKQGKRVLVLEQHDQAGEVGEPGKGGRILMDYITDDAVDWQPMNEAYDVAVFRTETKERKYTANVREEFVMRSGAGAVAEELKKTFTAPEDVAAIDEYFEQVRVGAKCPRALFIRNMLPGFLSTLASWLFAKEFTLISKTTAQVLSSITSNSKLKGVLCYLWGDFGDTPQHSSWMSQAVLQNTWRRGAYYPVGGPSCLASAIIKVIEKHGGKVLVRAPVSELIVDTWGRARGVRTKAGDDILAPCVVSAVGARNTFMRLVPEQHKWRVKRQLQGLASATLQGEVSLASLFVGIDDAQEVKGASRNYWVFPSGYDHEAILETCRKEACSAPFAFISFPSAKDPTYQARCPGKQSAVVLTPCTYSFFEKFASDRVKRRGKEYVDMKDKLKEALLDIFLTEFPEFKDKIAYVDVGTAVTNDFYLGTYKGQIYGLPHTPERFAADWLRPRTPISGLYLTGQDVLMSGILGAAMGGLLCASTISWGCLLNVIPMVFSPRPPRKS